MRIAPSADVADLVHERCERNSALPIRELMWGLPGSMLACVHMHAINGEPRWRRLFAAQAARLLDDLEETPLGPLWNQDLYGGVQPWLGPVHGYAGNMIPLLRGWEWLTQSQQSTRRGRRAAHAPCDRLPIRHRRDVAFGCDPAGPADPLSALSRCSGHGDDVRRRAVHLARA